MELDLPLQAFTSWRSTNWVNHQLFVWGHCHVEICNSKQWLVVEELSRGHGSCCSKMLTRLGRWGPWGRGSEAGASNGGVQNAAWGYHHAMSIGRLETIIYRCRSLQILSWVINNLNRTWLLRSSLHAVISKIGKLDLSNIIFLLLSLVRKPLSLVTKERYTHAIGIPVIW